MEDIAGFDSDTTPAASKKAASPAASAQTSEETSLYEGSEKSSPLDRKIGPLSMNNVSLAMFLQVVTQQSKVSFLINDDVKDTPISITLSESTTVREVMDVIFRQKGLTYQRVGRGNMYSVQRRSKQATTFLTKIYTLNYIPLIALEATGQAKSSLGSADSTSSSSDSSSDKSKTLNAAGLIKKDSSPSEISILNILKSVLSKEGEITVDSRSNSLVITDIPEVFPQIEQIIAELDKKTPQILIEARIVEVNTDKLNELGIEWGGDSGQLAYFQGPVMSTDILVRPGYFSGNQWTKFRAQSSNYGENYSGISTGDYGYDSDAGVAFGALDLSYLTALFKALITRTEAHYVGNPKILTTNNSKSSIRIVTDEAIGFDQSENSDTGNTHSTPLRAITGLSLDVTPQINRDGYITLKIDPIYSTAIDSSLTSTSNPVKDVQTRSASTLVRVKNGQTIVIGGMLKTEESKTVRKVPLLGYIPIVGWLFTSTSSERENTDLVFFITPTILTE